MIAESDVPAIYKDGRINVWVEDEATAAYLKEVWNHDIAFRFLIGGGRTTVAALSKHADENDIGNVFGIEDQDFGTSNEDDWLLPGKTFRKFTLPVLEIENLMLDSDAMEQCSVNNSNKSGAEISTRMKSKAEQLVTYMACRATIAEIRRQLCDDFIKHPNQSEIVDLHAAEVFICECVWFQRVLGQSSNLSRSWVTNRLSHYEVKFRGDVESDRWQRTFSGKEILSDAASYFYQAPKRERSVNVEKAIGKWQFENKRVPDCLTDLRTALLKRVQRQK